MDKKLQEINDLKSSLSDERVAILAALDIAGDYFQLKKEKEELVSKINKRSSVLINELDSVII